MPLAPRFQHTPVTPPPAHPHRRGGHYAPLTPVENIRGEDIVHEFGILDDEHTFTKGKIVKADIKERINELFDDESAELGKWRAWFNYAARRIFNVGKSEIEDDIVDDHIYDDRFESYVKEGKLKEKLLEIRESILNGSITNLRKERLIPMLIVAMFLNARYGARTESFTGGSEHRIFDVLDKEVLHSPTYKTLETLFKAQFNEQVDICPIDEHGNIVLVTPQDSYGEPLTISNLVGSTTAPDLYSIQSTVRAGSVLGVDERYIPSIPTNHTFFQVYTAYGPVMMNGSTNEVLKINFGKGEVEVEDVEFGTIEEENAVRTRFGWVNWLFQRVSGRKRYFQTSLFVTVDGDMYSQKNEYVIATPATTATPATYRPKRNRLGFRKWEKFTLHEKGGYDNTFVRVEGDTSNYSKEDLKALAESLGIRTRFTRNKTIIKKIQKESDTMGTGEFNDMVLRYNHLHGKFIIPKHGRLSIFHPSNAKLTEDMIYDIGKAIGVFTLPIWDSLSHKREVLVAEIVNQGKMGDFLSVYYNTLMSGLDDMSI